MNIHGILEGTNALASSTSGRVRAGACVGWLLMALAGTALAAPEPTPSSCPVGDASATLTVGRSSSATLRDRLFQAHRTLAEVELGHLSWAPQKPGSKPTLEAYLPEADLWKRVDEPLRMSAALEALYSAPITQADLQAEMNRQAVATKDPERLRELWAALGNDPALIAEALARPILAENSLRARYYADEKIHGALKAKALGELAGLSGPEGLKGLSGEYHEVEYRLAPEGKTALPPEEGPSERIIHQEPKLWRAQIEALCATLGRPSAQDPSALAGAMGRLEDGVEYEFVQGAVEAGPDRVRIGTMSWKKIPFGVWWAAVREGYSTGDGLAAAPAAIPFALPSIPEKPLAGEVWDAITTTGAPLGRRDFACWWTGSVMVVWGGWTSSNAYLNSGGRYNPTTDSWTATSTGTHCPAGQSAVNGSKSVWTGTELVIWNNDSLAGSRYNPVTDLWAAMSVAGAPSQRDSYSMVWDETGVIVWGGSHGAAYDNIGGEYNPTADTWTATGVMNELPPGRVLHTATWDPQHNWMYVWGGLRGMTYLNTGALYDGSSLWYTLNASGAPTARTYHTQVTYPGVGILVWGGSDGYNCYNTGGFFYGDTAGSWRTITTTGAPTIRYFHGAIWASAAARMIIWGGDSGNGTLLNTGASYEPWGNAWTPITTTNAPSPRSNHGLVDIADSGTRMIVWGGETDVAPWEQSGAIYTICATTAPALQSAPVTAADIDSCSQGIRITWKDAAAWYDSGYGTRSYGIYRNGTLLATYPYGTTAYYDHTTAAGTSYSYSVAYTNGCGTSTTTGTVSATDTQTGSIPTGLTNPTVSADSDLCNQNTFTVSWAKEPGAWNDGGASSNRKYHIEVDGGEAASFPYSSGTTSTTISLPMPTNTPHLVTVSYMNGCYYTATTAGVNATDYVMLSPVVPAITAADVSGCADTGVVVAWPADATDWGDHGSTAFPRTYSVSRGGVYLATGLAYGTTSYTDTTGTNGVSYQYGVRYSNGCKVSAPSLEVSAIDNVGVAPSTLTNNTAADVSSCADTGVVVTWAKDAGSWGDNGTGTRTYDVLRNASAIATGIAYGTTTYTDTTGVNGTSYTYTVRYDNGCGLNAVTTGVSASDVAPAAPSALTNNTASDVSSCADGGVTVTWTQDAGSWGDNGVGTRTYAVLRDGSAIASGGCTGSIAYATTSCTDTTGVNGTNYSYAVRYNNGCSLNAATTGVLAMDFVGSAPSSLANNTAADVSTCADSGVTVTWVAPGSWGDNGSGTRTVDVLRAGTAIATGLASTTTTYTDTTGTNGTAYTYTVRFNNGCSLNATTTGASATDVVGVAPSSLTNNTAADVSTCADSGVTVTWVAPGSWGDNGSGTRSIDVLRAGAPIATGLASTATTYTDTTGTNGAAYAYTVRFNNGCSLSATTAGASATDNVSAAPATLTNNTSADVSACADSGVTITWTADAGSWGDNGSGTRTYTVLRGGTPVSGSIAYGTTTFTDTTGTNGTPYTYSVRYNNGCGLNAATTGVSATDTVGAAPSSLTNNTAADLSACADTGVTINWAAPGNWGDAGSGVRSIDVLRGGTPIVTGLSATTTSHTDGGGTNGTSYTYTVRFNNGCGLNAATAGASATDQVGAAPSSLTNNTAADVSACADSGVTVTWGQPGNWGDNGSGTRTIDVLRAGTPITTGLAATATTYTDTTGTNGISYSYTVRFNNGCSLNASTTGNSATDVVDTTPCSAVGNTLTLADAGTNLNVGWSAVTCPDLANYRVYGATSYAATFPSGWTLLGQPTGTNTTDPMGSSYVVFKTVTVDACGNASAY